MRSSTERYPDSFEHEESLRIRRHTVDFLPGEDVRERLRELHPEMPAARIFAMEGTVIYERDQVLQMRRDFPPVLERIEREAHETDNWH